MPRTRLLSNRSFSSVREAAYEPVSSGNLCESGARSSALRLTRFRSFGGFVGRRGCLRAILRSVARAHELNEYRFDLRAVGVADGNFVSGIACHVAPRDHSCPYKHGPLASVAFCLHRTVETGPTPAQNPRFYPRTSPPASVRGSRCPCPVPWSCRRPSTPQPRQRSAPPSPLRSVPRSPRSL